MTDWLRWITPRSFSEGDVVAIDSETDIMRAGAVAPKPVCWTFHDVFRGTRLLTYRDGLFDELRALLRSGRTLVSHNAAYEATTSCGEWPELTPLWFEAYSEGRVLCTVVREKLLNLSTHGKLDTLQVGLASKKISYTLASLILDYFGEDRSAEKGEDSWRLNYSLLAGLKASEFPPAAADYAKQDAVDHFRLFFAQERRLAAAKAQGFDKASMATQEIQSAADFALRLMTCRGFKLDTERKAKVEKWLEEELAPSKLVELTVDTVVLRDGRRLAGTITSGREILDCAGVLMNWDAAGNGTPRLNEKGKQIKCDRALPSNAPVCSNCHTPPSVTHLGIQTTEGKGLDVRREDIERIEHRIMDPGSPARPYKNNAKNHDGSLKMIAAKAPSIFMRGVKERIERVCIANQMKIDLTETGEIKASKDTLSRLVRLDPVLGVYEHRQSFQKIKTTEMPRLSGAYAHAPINILVETGRTSSYEMKNKSKRAGAPRAIFPSFNGQNAHPKVRPIMEARPGTAIFSVDYHAIDLVMFAQLQVKLFGSSVLGDGFNADVDPHAYLGAQLAHALDPRYRAAVERAGVGTPMDNWRFFDRLKKVSWAEKERQIVLPAGFEWVLDAFGGQVPEAPKGGFKGGSFFKHYRTFAKPTGLGYPGGLGPDTFIDFARTPYGVIVNREQAVELRDIWRSTYPEAPMYLDYINSQCVDPTAVGMTDEDGDSLTLYRYTSPLGMTRSRATYCAAANGYGLQTPEAEGMKMACVALQRACWDPTVGSPLYGRVFPIVMIHDEIVGEVLWEPGSEAETGELLNEVGRIMVREMRKITPDVKVKTAGLAMKRWYKEEDDAKAAGDLIWKSAA